MAKGVYTSRAQQNVEAFSTSDKNKDAQETVQHVQKKEEPIEEPVNEEKSTSDLDVNIKTKPEVKPAKEENKGKSGRPSNGPVKKISLAIPEDVYTQMETAAQFYKGNMTNYINSIIKKDLESNNQKYTEFDAFLKQMGVK